MECPLQIKHIVHQLSTLPGITRYYLLDPDDRKFIFAHENASNVGVLEAVKREYVICLVHDSSWREPTQKIVKKENGEIVFPPVLFPEVAAHQVVSSSPGMDVHTYLCQRVRVEGDEATLLIGFDLQTINHPHVEPV